MSMDTDPESTPADSLERETPETGWEHLHPHARLGMRLSTVLGFFFGFAPPAALLLGMWDPPGLSALAKLGLFAILLVLLAALGWRYGNARYARTRYALDAVGLRIQRGLVWRSETLVPRSRVQHTDINRGPLDRHFGLATLKVYTAGTKLASVALDGLPEARAIELRDALVSRDDDAV